MHIILYWLYKLIMIIVVTVIVTVAVSGIVVYIVSTIVVSVTATIVTVTVVTASIVTVVNVIIVCAIEAVITVVHVTINMAVLLINLLSGDKQHSTAHRVQISSRIYTHMLHICMQRYKRSGVVGQHLLWYAV
jgi:hypothetical protein